MRYTDGSTTWFVWDEEGTLLEELDQAPANSGEPFEARVASFGHDDRYLESGSLETQTYGHGAFPNRCVEEEEIDWGETMLFVALTPALFILDMLVLPISLPLAIKYWSTGEL